MTKEFEWEFEWASQTGVDALQPHVEEILESLADLLCQPGILSAFVSDESDIGDFLDDRETLGGEYDEKLKRNVTSVTMDTKKNRATVEEMSLRLGVKVGIYDRVYEVAIRLRDK